MCIRVYPWLILCLLLLAVALRLSGVAWDGGIGAHPDEVHLVGVAEGLRWPERMDPFALDPAFAYGHLPLYLLALVGGTERLLAGRLLAALFDTATVALTAALGRRLGGWRAGLLAAAFLAVMPLHVQQAHFCTADPFLAFFATGTLLFAVRLADGGRGAAWAGLFAGLAVGCKAAAALLALPLAAGCAVGPGTGRQRTVRAAVAAGAALAGFAVTNPFALLELPRFAANLADQAALVRGALLVPYTLQYHGTLPYVYPLIQQAIWGMGPGLALLGVAELGATLWRAARRRPAPAEWVALAWALPYLAFTDALFVKFPRYLLPVTPLLTVYAARAVAAAGGRVPLARRARAAAISLALAPAGWLSLALVVSYCRPHSWVAASAWLRQNVPPGSVIAVEAWDHPLPLDSTGYDVRVLPVFDEETDAKWAAMEETLAGADVVVIASRRGYGALAGWPQRFPRTTAYYRGLLGGELGFRAAACFGRWPRLGALSLADDPFAAASDSAPSRGQRPKQAAARKPNSPPNSPR